LFYPQVENVLFFTKMAPKNGAWGQALPLGKDIFMPLALKAFPRIRPDPD
jgi:hypothetical protein